MTPKAHQSKAPLYFNTQAISQLAIYITYNIYIFTYLYAYYTVHTCIYISLLTNN